MRRKGLDLPIHISLLRSEGDSL